ncbi:MAG TPA: hypothetical protein VL989_02110 [Candidatus Sulfotelmatobacter sp.]|nr:hypothetical protein [Candidatus Sulfotelmatobacter sp.]
MSDTPEKQTKQTPVLHMRPEGYFSATDPELLDQLKKELEEGGVIVSNPLFSGFDGAGIRSARDVPRTDAIFGMNEAGWREAIKLHEPNPFEYAEGYDVPCIGVYEGNELSEIYASDIDQDSDLSERIQLSDIEIGENLSSMPTNQPVREAVVHRHYPEGSPVDALVALVFVDR